MCNGAGRSLQLGKLVSGNLQGTVEVYKFCSFNLRICVKLCLLGDFFWPLNYSMRAIVFLATHLNCLESTLTSASLRWQAMIEFPRSRHCNEVLANTILGNRTRSTITVIRKAGPALSTSYVDYSYRIDNKIHICTPSPDSRRRLSAKAITGARLPVERAPQTTNSMDATAQTGAMALRRSREGKDAKEHHLIEL